VCIAMLSAYIGINPAFCSMVTVVGTLYSLQLLYTGEETAMTIFIQFHIYEATWGG